MERNTIDEENMQVFVITMKFKIYLAYNSLIDGMVS